MRQRVMIAMALVNNPDLLIADEPTTALDVTTQAQILDLMKRLQDEFGSAIIMITHDLGVVAEVADDVVVMYAARVQEEGEVRDLFQRPEPPVHLGPARLAAAPAPGRRAARADLRPAAVAALPAARVPLPSALPVRDADLQGDRARARGRARGSQSYHRVRCHLDQETKDREAAKVIEGTLAEVELRRSSPSRRTAPSRGPRSS